MRGEHIGRVSLSAARPSQRRRPAPHSFRSGSPGGRAHCGASHQLTGLSTLGWSTVASPRESSSKLSAFGAGLAERTMVRLSARRIPCTELIDAMDGWECTTGYGHDIAGDIGRYGQYRP